MSWTSWSEETLLSKALSAALAAEENKKNHEGENAQSRVNDEKSLEVNTFISRIKDKVTTMLELRPVEPSMRYYGSRTDPPKLAPLRLVCAVDVSHSMAEPYGTDGVSKLDKMKMFMQLLVKTINHEDQLGIVTFGTKSKVTFPLKRMSQDNKEACQTLIHGIQLSGVTNLGAGVLSAIDQFNTNSYVKNPFYDDNILLFTDGMANEGIADSSDMIKEIRKKIRTMKDEGHFEKDYAIKIISMGTGGFLSELLYSVGQAFSSDPFYFLDEKSSLELNLMKPIVMRQYTIVSCVRVRVDTLNGVMLNKGEMSTVYEVDLKDSFYHLDSLECDTMGNVASGLPDQKTSEYVIHDIGAGMERHILVCLKLPHKHKKVLKGKDVVKFAIKYRDSNLETHKLEKVITYEDLPRKEKQNQELDVAMIARQDCRFMAQRALDQAADVMKKLDRAGAKILIQTGIQNMRTYSEYVANLLTSEETYNNLMQYIEPIMANLEYVDKFLGDYTVRWDDAWGRLKALSSSLSREVPTATGVCAEGLELFTAEKVQNKLGELAHKLREIYSSLGISTEVLDKYLTVMKELEVKLAEREFSETSI